MRFKELSEVSPPTFKGSLTPDLLKSKIWLCNNLKKIGKTKFSTIYVLGSWYGSMAVILNRCGIEFEKIINVDADQNHITKSHRVLSALGINVQSMQKDANTLNYKQLDNDSLVINTSIDDINGTDWFNRLPEGTLVAMQSRNNANDSAYDSLEALDQKFILSNTLVLDELSLEDPETKYQRFMKIGIK
jgi:hypothetical protein